jgi:glycosyl transferase family 25
MQNFSVFVINLPTATARRLAIEKQLNSFGVDYEIVPGIFGNDDKVVARYDDDMSKKERGKSLIFGEKGCALAHALIYERMVREKIPVALILEDDIVLPKNFFTIITKEVSKTNKKWDWLLFDYRYVGYKFIYHWLVATLKTIYQKPSFVFYAFLKIFYMIPLSIFEGIRNFLATKSTTYSGPKKFYRPLFNAGAYLITLEGAEKLLSYINPLRFSADEIPNVARRRSGFKFYGYVPLVVHQNTVDFATDAGKTDEDWKRYFRENSVEK